MAQDTTAELPGISVRRSISDRPFAYRFLWHTGQFFVRKPLGGFGIFIIFGMIFMALAAPLIDRYPPDRVALGEVRTCAPDEVENFRIVCFSPELAERAQDDPLVRIQYAAAPSRFDKGIGGGVPLQNANPSSDHWLGTDAYGRDLYSRIVHGSQLALLVGVGGALIAVSMGTIVGMVSAYFGGWVDLVIQRITDAFFAFPSLILLLLFTQVVEKPTKYHITLALGIVGISQVVRIARSAVLTTRQEMFVTAATTVGASDFRIMLRHILPNIVAPLIVIFTISIGLYILAEAGLAFIGLGDPVAISWGKMINEARRLGSANPLPALWLGLAITFAVLGFNLAGDALRDVLDPRLRGRGGRAGF
jgi:peptide/nickel transport system permease protein